MLLKAKKKSNPKNPPALEDIQNLILTVIWEKGMARRPKQILKPPTQQTDQQTTTTNTLPDLLKSKCNQATKTGQPTDHNAGNISSKNHAKKNIQRD